MGFIERIENNQKIKAWKGNIPVEFVYTTGTAGEKFFRALRDSGKILGSTCKKCRTTYVPARLFCERCMDELTEFTDVGRVGTLIVFTTVNMDARGKHLAEPRILGLVQFENAAGGVLHYIKSNDNGNIRIGAKVEAVFEPKESRKGLITDIKHFRMLD
ncbi:MAG TPA: Zn-ribbon domain-containing OB-fold protein [bacterium]